MLFNGNILELSNGRQRIKGLRASLHAHMHEDQGRDGECLRAGLRTILYPSSWQCPPSND
ncbi:hypothetical protein PHJA_000428300 [Phtheirospermum japonicum]|uniref:Uncharacterized protein n=1 Tax=Phtheirospermum japonicum TaxID=374723 RepID=A0A830BA39_9LAMI|nr:hypothetical protein PHJA_000428300 [Phtheirospermum japonicum]